jgi:hypothetical protein
VYSKKLRSLQYKADEAHLFLVPRKFYIQYLFFMQIFYVEKICLTNAKAPRWRIDGDAVVQVNVRGRVRANSEELHGGGALAGLRHAGQVCRRYGRLRQVGGPYG